MNASDTGYLAHFLVAFEKESICMLWKLNERQKFFIKIFMTFLKGGSVEIKRHIIYFHEQIELPVAPKKEAEKPWASPNTGCFSTRWPLLGARKSSPKKLKNNFFQYMLYSLKAHAHYLTVFIYLETWRGPKLGVFIHFTFENLPRCSQSMNSYVYRSPVNHSRDHNSLYYHRPKKIFVLPLDWSSFLTLEFLPTRAGFPLGQGSQEIC